MLKIIFGAVFALFVAGTASAQDTIAWKNDVQGWNVAVDRTIDNSCFIISGFENELFLRFQFNSTLQNLQFIVASVQWDSVKNGQDYNMEVTFGDRDPWSGMAEGHRWNGVLPSLVLSVPIEDQQASHFMRDFSATNSVRISHEGSEIAALALAGADEALASMMDCQASMSNVDDLTKSGADPFVPEIDPI